MVENNDKGKKARRYFIEKEKELKKLEKSNNDQVSHLRIPDFSNPAEAARAWADEYEAKVKAEKEAMLALEAKNKVEEEKKIVQAELNTAIDTIKEYLSNSIGFWLGWMADFCLSVLNVMTDSGYLSVLSYVVRPALPYNSVSLHPALLEALDTFLT